MQSWKLRAIKTVKTRGLLSFRYLRQQAFESKVKEDEVKVITCCIRFVFFLDT